MAKPAAKAVLVKKKGWVPIIAPALFSEQQIGESFVEEPQQLVGRSVTVSLMTLTNDPQRQSVNVSFKITGVKNNAVTTELVGYSMLAAAAKKLMRRSRDRIDDSFIVETSDKKFVRVKPMIITRNRTRGSVLATMQKLERAYISKMISQTDFESLVRDVAQKRFQHGLVQMLKRLYPVSVCEIRQIELITAEKVKELGLKIMIAPEKLPELPKRASKEGETEEASETPQAEESAA